MLEHYLNKIFHNISVSILISWVLISEWDVCLVEMVNHYVLPKLKTVFMCAGMPRSSPKDSKNQILGMSG